MAEPVSWGVVRSHYRNWMHDKPCLIKPFIRLLYAVLQLLVQVWRGCRLLLNSTALATMSPCSRKAVAPVAGLRQNGLPADPLIWAPSTSHPGSRISCLFFANLPATRPLRPGRVGLVSRQWPGSGNRFPQKPVLWVHHA